MKIFFTVSRTGLPKYLPTYELVLKELKNHKVHVEATFVKSHAEKVTRIRSQSKAKGKSRYANDAVVRKGILLSEALVIEASHPSSRLGFEAFYALTIQKPVLVLSRLHDYADLIDQPHFFGAKYTDFTLPDEIEKFLKHVEHYNLRSRFNLFIADNQKKHLEESAKHFGVSMSDYVRKLIDSDM